MEMYKQTNMTSARLFTESEKLVQADDEFAKQLKVCAKTWEDAMNIHSKCKIWCFGDIILYSCNFT